MEIVMDLGSTPSLKQQVHDRLQYMIIHGDLKPGEKISEEELARNMNISRSPVREAINMLERDGFIVNIPRKGSIVSTVTDQDVHDIWVCRLAIEPLAARLAAPNVPRKAAVKTLKTLNDMRLYPGNVEKFIESDLQVHGLFTEYIDNSYMRTMLDHLKRHSVRARWLRASEKVTGENFMEQTSEHQRIVQAFLEHDAEEAYSATLMHIQGCLKRIDEENEIRAEIRGEQSPADQSPSK